MLLKSKVESQHLEDFSLNKYHLNKNIPNLYFNFPSNFGKFDQRRITVISLKLFQDLLRLGHIRVVCLKVFYVLLIQNEQTN